MSLLVLGANDVDVIASKFTTQYLESLMQGVFASVARGAPDSGKKNHSNPLRSSVTMEKHTALFMPARIRSLGTSIKIVSVPNPSQGSKGLPASTVVLDEDTGAVKAIVNARNLTALRNAAGEYSRPFSKLPDPLMV
jgi:ornithine cyclodeaminase/alanine dehydrogenase-like protein (mu-crystallin family)